MNISTVLMPMILLSSGVYASNLVNDSGIGFADSTSLVNIDKQNDNFVNLDIEVLEFRTYGSTLLVKEGCYFEAYYITTTESVFVANCGDNSIFDYKVQNDDWNVKSFKVEHGVNMETPLKLSGRSFGVDIQKYAESLLNKANE